jgi:hypothetical protein
MLHGVLSELSARKVARSEDLAPGLVSREPCCEAPLHARPRLVLLVLAWSLTGLVSCQGDGDPPDNGELRKAGIDPISDWPGRVDAGAVIGDPGGESGHSGSQWAANHGTPVDGPAGRRRGRRRQRRRHRRWRQRGRRHRGWWWPDGWRRQRVRRWRSRGRGARRRAQRQQRCGASVPPADGGAPADADLDEDAQQDGAADGSTDDASGEPECVFGWLGRGCRRPMQDP